MAFSNKIFSIDYNISKMEMIRSIAHNTVDVLLNDPATEDMEQQSDRMGGSISSNAAMAQQATVKMRTTYDPATNSRDDMKSQNFDVSLGHLNPSKLVELASGEWTPASGLYSQIVKVDLPQAFYPNASYPARGQTRYFQFLRTGFQFQVNVNAAAGVAGAAILVYAPRGLDLTTRSQDSLFMLDHVEINVDANSSGMIKLPYMNVSNYANTDSADQGSVYVIVLSRLTAPPNVDPTVTITVFGAMYDMDLQNPRPQGPIRQRVDIAEGPGSMNMSNHRNLQHCQSLALCGESVLFDSKTAGNSVPIDSLRDLTPVKQIIEGSRFEWRTSQVPGDTVFAYNLRPNDSPLMQMLSSSYRLWRGSLVLTVQLYATKFNKGRVRIAFFPNSIVDYTNQQANNSIYTVHELGLNTAAELVVPFSSANWLRSTKFSEELGRFKIFVVNRLQANVNAPASVRGFVTIRFGDDVEFIAPIDRNVRFQGDEQTDAVVSDTSPEAANAAGVTTPENAGGSPKTETPKPKMLVGEITHIRPVRDDHMKLKNLFGRSFFMGDFRLSQTVGTIDLRPPATGHGALMKLFLYFTGDLTISIRNRDSDAIYVSHAYDEDSVTTVQGQASMGVVVIPPNSMMSIRVPYYSVTPLRIVTNSLFFPPTFGSLHIRGENEDVSGPSVSIWMSFENPKFYRPAGVPNALTTNEGPDGDDIDGKTTLSARATVSMIPKLTCGISHERGPTEFVIDTELVAVDNKFPLIRVYPRKYLRQTLIVNEGDCAVEALASCAHGCSRRKTIVPGQVTTIVPCHWHWRDFNQLRVTAPQFCVVSLRCGYRKELLQREGIETNPGPRDMAKPEIIQPVPGNGPLLDSFQFFATVHEMGGQCGVCIVRDDGEHIDLVLESQQINNPILRAPIPGSVMIRKEQIDLTKIGKHTNLPPIQVAHAIMSRLSGFLGEVPSVQIRRLLTLIAMRSVCGELSDESFSDLGTMLSAFFSNQYSKMIGQLARPQFKKIRTLIRAIAKCAIYTAMIAVNPTMSTVAMVATLAGLDIEDCEGVAPMLSSLLGSLFEGNFRAASDAIYQFMVRNSGLTTGEKILDSVGTQLSRVQKKQGVSDVLKDFNLTTLACKSFAWWVSTIKGFVDVLRSFFCPTQKEKALAVLKRDADIVLGLLAHADNVIMEMSQKRDFTESDKSTAIKLMERLSDVRVVTRQAEANIITNQITMMVDKLSRQLNRPLTSPDVMRPEPVGILLYGKPGQGKTAFALALCERITEIMELDKPGVYTQNSVDSYMTGYHGQWFHILDDFLQMRDDEDARNVCQMISGVPWRPNMAELADKGVSYTSKVVIATTNRPCLDPHNMTDIGALQRRFAYQIEVSAADDYSTPNGKLDMGLAEIDGAVWSGKCWNNKSGKYGSWGRIDLQTLAADIARDVTHREKIVASMTGRLAKLQDQGDSEPQSDLDDAITRLGLIEEQTTIFRSTASKSVVLPKLTPSEELKTWFTDAVSQAVSVWEALKPWCQAVAGVCGVLGALIGIYTLVRVNKVSEEVACEDEARAYAGPATKPKTVKNSRVIVRAPLGEVRNAPGKDQGPVDEFVHLLDRCGYIRTATGKAVYFLGLKDKTMIVFGHAVDTGLLSGTLCYNGMEFPLDDSVTLHVDPYGTDRATIDMVMVTIPQLPFFFKNSVNLIRKCQNETAGWMVSQAQGAYVTRPVTKIQYAGMYVSETNSGVLEAHDAAVRYFAQTGPGDCGSVIIQKQGANWYFVAMHVSGSRCGMAYGVSLGHVCQDQGVVTSVQPNPHPMWNPSKTKLAPSPLHGVFQVEMGPAPLHPRDPRIECPPENLVKECAKKYRVNHFEPCPDLFVEAKEFLTTKILNAIGVHPALDNWEDAINGLANSNPIDMSTSAGPEFTSKQLTKKDLFKVAEDGRFYMTPRLAEVVESKWQRLQDGESVATVFGAVLKDELIKTEKIRLGKTRCIEACGVDYVTIYRRVMGSMYDVIYTTPATATTIAVGINPASDYHGLFSILQGPTFGIDYSKFDGSLSKQLMQAAVDVLAACHEDPDLVRRLHEPVINSTHWVADEIWTVFGGMPSGSPCTSVLNSVCNSLVVYTTLMAAGATDLKDVTLVTYGDDVLGAVGANEVRFDEVPMYIQEWFGMEATSADKKSNDISLPREEAMFLKRRFAYFPGTRFVVGQLDLDSMKNRIMWCRGREEFESQFEAFQDELVNHGESVYEEIREKCWPYLRLYGIRFSPYTVRRRMVFARLFV